MPAGAKPFLLNGISNNIAALKNGTNSKAHNTTAVPSAAANGGCVGGQGVAAEVSAAADAPASAVQLAVPDWFALHTASRSSGAGSIVASQPLSHDAKLKQGMYGVVRSLLRVLERGTVGKAIVDTVVDACSAMQVR